MLVKDLMSPGPEFVAVDAPLRAAAERMHAAGTGLLAVRDGGQIAGVLTDRDIALRPVARSQPYETAVVRDIMTPAAHAVRTTTPLVKVAEAFKTKGVGRLLVLDERARLAGVISVEDLAAEDTVRGLACDVIGVLAEQRSTPADALEAS